MMNFMFLVLAMTMTVNLNSWAGALPLILKSSDKKEWIFHSKDRQKVSESCLSGKCLALTAKKKTNPEAQTKYQEHPAAVFCENLEGKYEIARHASGDEDGICVFKDKSFILAWDLYYLHHPKKVTP